MFDIEVFGLDERAAFFTDRWGDANLSTEGAREAIAAAGFTPDEIRSIAKRHDHAFQAETTFLAHLPCPPWPAEGSKENHLALFVEFEIDEDYLPEQDITDAETPGTQDAWLKTFQFWAPALAHAAKGVAEIEDEAARQIRIFFNLDTPYGGGLGAFIPLAAAQHHEAVEKLLFRNDLPFPPSNHAQFEALAAIRWRAAPALPRAAFPGQCCPLDWGG